MAAALSRPFITRRTPRDTVDSQRIDSSDLGIRHAHGQFAHGGAASSIADPVFGAGLWTCAPLDLDQGYRDMFVTATGNS